MVRLRPPDEAGIFLVVLVVISLLASSLRTIDNALLLLLKDSVIGQGSAIGIPILAIVLLVAATIVAILLKRAKPDVHVYACGRDTAANGGPDRVAQ